MIELRTLYILKLELIMELIINFFTTKTYSKIKDRKIPVSHNCLIVKFSPTPSTDLKYQIFPLFLQTKN